MGGKVLELWSERVARESAAKGEEKGRFEILFEDVSDGLRTEAQAAQRANIPLEAFQEKYKKWKNDK